MATPPRPWKRIGSQEGPDLLIFRTRFEDLENPRTGQVLRRVVLDTPDWVNVVALTPSQEVVLVRQFRFGRGEVTLEIPGGMVDPGEHPEAAARRELLEETGFVAGSWECLGIVEPNPAFHTNLCHLYLARDAVSERDPSPDPGEDLTSELRPLEELAACVRRGEIRHSLVICALARVVDLRSDG